jgi:hypothetical protein
MVLGRCNAIRRAFDEATGTGRLEPQPACATGDLGCEVNDRKAEPFALAACGPPGAEPMPTTMHDDTKSVAHGPLGDGREEDMSNCSVHTEGAAMRPMLFGAAPKGTRQKKSLTR